MLIESPINYMGSKYKLLDKLIPLFPKDKKVFYDLFTGGGSVYMNVAELYEQVVANDILCDLIDIHKNLSNDEFIQEAKNNSVVTKDCKNNYNNLRESYNIYHETEKLLSLIWSCNSNMMRFNKDFKFNQTWGRRCFNKNTQKKVDVFKTKDYSNVSFLSQKFNEIDIELSKDTFVYLDPPYSNTEAGYNAFWNNEDDVLLMQLIQKLIDKNISFGISGVNNGKENKVFEFLEKMDLKIHYFDDLYKKISKKDKENTEYYITNVKL